MFKWNAREQWFGMTKTAAHRLTHTRGRCTVRQAWVPALETGRCSECSAATWPCSPRCGNCRISTSPKMCSVRRTTNSRCRLVPRRQSSAGTCDASLQWNGDCAEPACHIYDCLSVNWTFSNSLLVFIPLNTVLMLYMPCVCLSISSQIWIKRAQWVEHVGCLTSPHILLEKNSVSCNNKGTFIWNFVYLHICGLTADVCLRTAKIKIARNDITCFTFWLMSCIWYEMHNGIINKSPVWIRNRKLMKKNIL